MTKFIMVHKTKKLPNTDLRRTSFLIIGNIARLKYKFNYFTIMGMLAGTYTDPPALAYANQSCSKEAPAVGYSTVYPLSMFLRILTAQIIILLGCGAI